MEMLSIALRRTFVPLNAISRTMLLGWPADPNAQKKKKLTATQTLRKPSSLSGCGPGALT